jgi:hypothetical protein
LFDEGSFIQFKLSQSPSFYSELPIGRLLCYKRKSKKFAPPPTLMAVCIHSRVGIEMAKKRMNSEGEGGGRLAVAEGI